MSASRIVALYTLIGTILLSWTILLLIKTTKIPWPHKHQTPAPPPTAIMPITRTILLYYLLAISLLTLAIMLVVLARPIARRHLRSQHQIDQLRRFCRETPPVFRKWTRTPPARFDVPFSRTVLTAAHNNHRRARP